MPLTTESMNGQPPDVADAATMTIERPVGLAGDAQRLLERREARRERLERVEARAAEMAPGRAVATLAASLVFGVAWVVGKVLRVLWKALAFAVAAAQEGWDDALGRGPTKADLAAENASLRAELQRWSGTPPDTPPAASRPTRGVR